MQDESCKNTGPTFQSGTTYEPSHQQAESGALISSREDSPARTSALPETAKDLPANDPACGVSLPASFAYFDPDSCWWRMYQGCLPLQMTESRHPLDAFLESWPSSGMTRNGKAYRLPPLVPRNFAFACLSSPTLRATEWNGSAYQRDRGQKSKERPTLHGLIASWTPTGDRGGRGELLHFCKSGKPMGKITPSLNAASDKGPRKCATKAENGGHQVNLIDVTAHLSGKGGGVLNPRWCEWYMGFPDGWCDLPSEDLETA